MLGFVQKYDTTPCLANSIGKTWWIVIWIVGFGPLGVYISVPYFWANHGKPIGPDLQNSAWPPAAPFGDRNVVTSEGTGWHRLLKLQGKQACRETGAVPRVYFPVVSNPSQQNTQNRLGLLWYVGSKVTCWNNQPALAPLVKTSGPTGSVLLLHLGQQKSPKWLLLRELASW